MRQVPAQLHHLRRCLPCLTPSRPCGALSSLSHSLQTPPLPRGLSPTRQTSGQTPFSSSPPSFKCSAPKCLCDFISHPSYNVLASTIVAGFPGSFTFFPLPSLVRARVPSDQGHQGWAPASPGCVTSHYKLLKSCTLSPWVEVLCPSGKHGH